MENTALIRCEQLTVDNELNENANRVLNLSAKAGEIICLIGPDHENKSDWLQTIAGILEAESGQLFLSGRNTLQFDKEDWVKARSQFGYVRTDTAILSAANAMQNLMLPVMYHKTGQMEELRAKAQQLLLDIEAGDNLEQLPAHIKKEQRYKIAVARALMLRPQALFLDSPFTALDQSSINQFKQFLLNKVRNDHLLLILATHNTKFALQYSDQIIYVSEQQLLQFDKSHRIENCDIQEVHDYLAM